MAKLATLVGVEDQGPVESDQSFLQCLYTEISIHGVGQTPSLHHLDCAAHDRQHIRKRIGR